MPETNVNTPPLNQLEAVQPPGIGTGQAPRSTEPMALRRRPPNWSGKFWPTLTAGLPSTNLLTNPYFPPVHPTLGGWQTIIEQAMKPQDGRVEGVTGRNGNWTITPEEAMDLHGVQTAKRLLAEPPIHFGQVSGNTYFCFLAVAYSPIPEWAIIHRGGEVFPREDYRLSRPTGGPLMMAMVAGPVLELDPREVRLWEAVALHLNRAFFVVEDDQEEG